MLLLSSVVVCSHWSSTPPIPPLVSKNRYTTVLYTINIYIVSFFETADILTRLAASPAIVAVPIVGGLTVAFLIAYFIYSYGQGSEN